MKTGRGKAPYAMCVYLLPEMAVHLRKLGVTPGAGEEWEPQQTDEFVSEEKQDSAGQVRDVEAKVRRWLNWGWLQR